jgi:hypothetical protein
VLIGIFTVHGVLYQKNVCVSEGIVTISKLATRMGEIYEDTIVKGTVDKTEVSSLHIAS